MYSPNRDDDEFLSSDMKRPIVGAKKKRTTYDHAFKLKVVRAALERPQNNRIKPTCAWFPGIEPCQANAGTLNPSLPPPTYSLPPPA